MTPKNRDKANHLVYRQYRSSNKSRVHLKLRRMFPTCLSSDYFRQTKPMALLVWQREPMKSRSNYGREPKQRTPTPSSKAEHRQAKLSVAAERKNVSSARSSSR